MNQINWLNQNTHWRRDGTVGSVTDFYVEGSGFVSRRRPSIFNQWNQQNTIFTVVPNGLICWCDFLKKTLPFKHKGHRLNFELNYLKTSYSYITPSSTNSFLYSINGIYYMYIPHRLYITYQCILWFGSIFLIAVLLRQKEWHKFKNFFFLYCDKE